jgi:hypothetical protein
MLKSGNVPIEFPLCLKEGRPRSGGRFYFNASKIPHPQSGYLPLSKRGYFILFIKNKKTDFSDYKNLEMDGKVEFFS